MFSTQMFFVKSESKRNKQARPHLLRKWRSWHSEQYSHATYEREELVSKMQNSYFFDDGYANVVLCSSLLNTCSEILSIPFPSSSL